MLFYVTREDGSVTGPHPVGVLRRGLVSGDFSYDTPACLSGTEDWLPIGEWGADISLEPDGKKVEQPSRARYSAILDDPGKKSAFRIFWAALSVGIGLLKTGFSLLTLGMVDLWVSLLVFGLGLLWGIGGVAELMRQAKKR
jgi:hypothetical protein